jgi:hypothetical protein
MSKIFIVAVLFLVSFSGSAQDKDVLFRLQTPENGSLTIDQPDELAKAIKEHVDVNRKMLGIKGYRIQIGLFSGRKGRVKAYSLKSDYLTKYPDKTDVYVSYSAPYFNVRVGNYFTKTQALKEFQEIKKEFPGAFIVEDLITVEEQ